jgi:sulfofructose kinase
MVVSYTDPGVAGRHRLAARGAAGRRDAVLVDTRWGEGSLAALKLGRKAGVPGVIDADRQPTHHEMVTTASHVAFSEKALREISGGHDPRAALPSIAARRADLARGDARAARRVLRREWRRSPISRPFPIEAVDTLGAGDVWHGAFALALAEGQERASGPLSPRRWRR